MNSMLKLEKVTKAFVPGNNVVRNLSLEVKRGDRLALLGVNGAGKTTTYRMILGLLRPDAGSILFEGEPLSSRPEHAQRNIGYLPERAALYPELTPVEYLQSVCALHGVRESRKPVENAIELCDLGEVRNRPAGVLSKGFSQRVALAAALVHDPALLILDEPTAGLDPVQVGHFHQLVYRLSGEKALLFSTHVINEAETLCRRAVVLEKGACVLDCPLPMPGKKRWRFEFRGGHWKAPEHAETTRLDDGLQRVVLELPDEKSASAVLKELTEAGAEPVAFYGEPNSIADFFKRGEKS